jgi:hypothetical protein
MLLIAKVHYAVAVFLLYWGQAAKPPEETWPCSRREKRARILTLQSAQ